ncbi:hypothetical protein OH76DRAFT_1477044 [Lentinus brumalis]|uniref:Uncharacterized protein n=1 Tax=Lentinus brumalis TaxID=2498619 RepID=A0A371DVA5_9APHY|nr:hypothetical protein OH76DRAFT_1477044 [Polyporus brumalis]
MKPDDSVLRVYGRWREQYLVAIPGRPSWTLTHVYDAPIPLSAPPGVGDMVQIIALSPAYYRAMYPYLYQHHTYDVYDPQLVGRVLGVRGEPDGGVVFAMEDERRVSTVGLVIIAVPPASDALGPSTESECPRRWLRELLSKERSRGGLETDAILLDDLGSEVTPIRVLRYPDPTNGYPNSWEKHRDRPVWRPWLE